MIANLNPQDLRRFRRVLTAIKTYNLPAIPPISGDGAILVRIERILKQMAETPVTREDRKPALLAEYQGRLVPINGLAPESLLESFDAECEEIGHARAVMLREIMVEWINKRRDFKRLAKKSKEAANAD